MPMNAAVRTLHNDMNRLRKAVGTEKKAESALKQAGFTEKAALGKIAARTQAIADRFTSGAQPPTASEITFLLNEEFSLGQQAARTTSRFDAAVISGKKAIAGDKKAVAADRKHALKDLKAGELHMNLKDTNRVRHELGLRGVAKVIRESLAKAPISLPCIDSSEGARRSSVHVPNAVKG